MVGVGRVALGASRHKAPYGAKDNYDNCQDEFVQLIFIFFFKLTLSRKKQLCAPKWLLIIFFIGRPYHKAQDAA